MTDSPAPIINLTRPDGKKHRFTFGEDLAERLKAEGITIAQVDKEGVSHKVEMQEKRGLEVIFRDDKDNKISLDQVVKKLIKGKHETPKQLNALRGNLVHALLQHYEEEAVTDNGCLSATLLETFASNDEEQKNPRYFVATIMERVNPETYSGRGCAETLANTMARAGYKSRENPHGDYVLSELHLRCYFTDPETNEIKFSHGKQCLCGVCRDVCEGLWTEDAAVWLHPINKPVNGVSQYLEVEQKDSPTGLDQSKISIVPASSMLPEKEVYIADQAAARQALQGFDAALKQITHSNEPHSRKQRLVLQKLATRQKESLEEQLLSVPDDQIYTVDLQEHDDGALLAQVNSLMVARLKQEIYTHLLAKDATAENWLDALPDTIDIAAGINPKTGHVAIVARRAGEEPASTAVVTTHLAEHNSNVRGLSEFFYTQFDKARFLQLLQDERMDITHHLPGGNERERAVKQKLTKEQLETPQERPLVQSHTAGLVDRQTTRQRWTIFPLNDGTLTAKELRKILHHTTAERVLGDWQGVKISNGNGGGVGKG